jgi:hypothetical protein
MTSLTTGAFAGLPRTTNNCDYSTSERAIGCAPERRIFAFKPIAYPSALTIVNNGDADLMCLRM